MNLGCGSNSDDDSVLDVNGGQKILLRLRPAWAPDTFYEEDDVVRTMLHEASSTAFRTRNM